MTLRDRLFPQKRTPGARELARTLAWLRLSAVAGQAVTVFIVSRWMDLAIPAATLSIGIAVLAVFALFALWRLEHPWRVRPLEVVLHIAVDTLVLGFLLYLTGGATNPFVSLLVVPIALSAAALALPYITAVTTLVGAAYILLLFVHVPLPGMQSARGLSLHVLGTAINFVITAALLGVFIGRLAGALREREGQVQRKRERALRDEGILAIATQAAGAAHELNTPLSTIRTLLTELRREHADQPQLADDLALLSGQTERCRDILREMVAFGTMQLAGTPVTTTLASFIDDCLERFSLLRPEVEVECTVPDDTGARAVAIEAGLRHALINLLSNAADASLATGSAQIELAIEATESEVDFLVRDHGVAVDAIPRGVGAMFRSSKRDGMGIGLALAQATAERLGGQVITQAAPGGGLMQCMRVPLSALQQTRRDS